MGHNKKGFTLIELMMVVVMIAILAAIAIPSYQEYIRRSNLVMTQQEMQKIAALLEKHRSRNFDYAGFLFKGDSTSQGPYFGVTNATDTTLVLPLNSSAGQQKYSLNLILNSQDWVIKAQSTDTNNYSLLLTSTGIRCKNKTWGNIQTTSCGVGAEDW
ncbi:type IV pilin protein [Acinetobacter soli]|uniref:type IV pilin protein n=1 Tax=Acinetobacter soli TaxID=487316 RepID=UPI00124E7E25|nr:type IV pilin protein [Acinetobacter soli]MBO3639099.1 prepilin-type N-terminal cleavage/methylation domain-containing protein [Acinetobacter soli]MEB4799417.1 type IV pilin protein [Acinetobacter soli]